MLGFPDMGVTINDHRNLKLGPRLAQPRKKRLKAFKVLRILGGSVVQNHEPAAILALIHIANAKVEGDRIVDSANRGSFDKHGPRHIPADLDEQVQEFDL